MMTVNKENKNSGNYGAAMLTVIKSRIKTLS